MGLFGGNKVLPRTSYGYQAPADARASGWICPGPDCGRAEAELPRRWPARCPECGTQVDPTFDEPWAHPARRLEIDHILRDPGRSSSLKDLMRVESDIWDYRDALMRRDHSTASRARRAFRQTTANITNADHYFVGGMGYFSLVLIGLEFGDTAGVVEELLAWYPTINTTDVENDNARRANSRYFVSSCVRFLEDTRGARHQDAGKIYRSMLDIATRIKEVLTTSNKEGIARIQAMRY